MCFSDRTPQEARGAKGLQQQPRGRDKRGDEALRGGYGRLAEGYFVAAEVRGPVYCVIV